jgi:hypothetical protein
MAQAHATTPNGLWLRHQVNRCIEVGWPLPAETVLPGADPNPPAVTYVCQPGARPYLHPVRAVASAQVLTQDRPADHPWQHGIFTGLHAVNGLDFWTEHRTPAAERGTIIHQTIDYVALDAGGARWQATSAWNGPTGQTLLIEEQVWLVHPPVADHYLIDLTWQLCAAGEPVTIGRYDYGGLAVRLVTHPDRRHLNSAGQTGAATSEARAAWCDVSAPFDGAPAWTADNLLASAWHGVAILDHPRNLGYPSAWRVDGHGLINPCPSLLGDWTVDGAGQVFRYRLVVHARPGDAAMLDRLQRTFAMDDQD